ncbi:matrixin family metalloprotease [Lacticaseibacillus thailandensis]|uniref:Zn-dependent protease n=1 Tax=Lacticaseibacillus thailandensis DSM 22698 = JCM 13996 TaxID=1423810 RepID=A0A0R2C7H8_9LACO|nr:matrixin family metalloprotease [Lacticaseibacillus thailandensis]KRM87729.1 Zn-dependent protease [Lacticaseibacillus thailandensis DSM 22698 = JCM 13996]
MKSKSWLALVLVPVAVLATGVWIKLDPRVNISRTEMVAKVKGYLGGLRSVLVQFPPLEHLANRIGRDATSDVSINSSSSSSQSQTTSSSASATTRNATTTASSNSDNAEQTPIESIVQGVQLANTYYYHFEADTPAAVQRVFTQAVAVYNATGIVSLRAGQGTNLQNRITLGVYNKRMGADAGGTLELGKGGPEIVQRISSRGQVTAVVNRSTARLNVDYADAIKLSVAIHELGHALGLDHSTSRNSVMYPIDQGLTHLSPADLAGLKVIYDQQ